MHAEILVTGVMLCTHINVLIVDGRACTQHFDIFVTQLHVLQINVCIWVNIMCICKMCMCVKVTSGTSPLDNWLYFETKISKSWINMYLYFCKELHLISSILISDIN